MWQTIPPRGMRERVAPLVWSRMTLHRPSWINFSGWWWACLGLAGWPWRIGWTRRRRSEEHAQAFLYVIVSASFLFLYRASTRSSFHTQRGLLKGCWTTSPKLLSLPQRASQSWIRVKFNLVWNFAEPVPFAWLLWLCCLIVSFKMAGKSSFQFLIKMSP